MAVSPVDTRPILILCLPGKVQEVYTKYGYKQKARWFRLTGEDKFNGGGRMKWYKCAFCSNKTRTISPIQGNKPETEFICKSCEIKLDHVMYDHKSEEWYD